MKDVTEHVLDHFTVFIRHEEIGNSFLGKSRSETGFLNEVALSSIRNSFTEMNLSVWKSDSVKEWLFTTSVHQIFAIFVFAYNEGYNFWLYPYCVILETYTCAVIKAFRSEFIPAVSLGNVAIANQFVEMVGEFIAFNARHLQFRIATIGMEGKQSHDVFLYEMHMTQSFYTRVK